MPCSFLPHAIMAVPSSSGRLPRDPIGHCLRLTCPLFVIPVLLGVSSHSVSHAMYTWPEKCVHCHMWARAPSRRLVRSVHDHVGTMPSLVPFYRARFVVLYRVHVI